MSECLKNKDMGLLVICCLVFCLLLNHITDAAFDPNTQSLYDAVSAYLTNPSDAQTLYGPITSWNTTGITDMSNLFSCYQSNFTAKQTSNCVTFNQDISAWNTGAVTSMAHMFSGANSFNQPIGVWDVALVTDMSNMFLECSAFNQPLINWITSSCLNMNNMFYSASTFQQDLDSWNVSQVVSMKSVSSKSTKYFYISPFHQFFVFIFFIF